MSRNPHPKPGSNRTMDRNGNRVPDNGRTRVQNDYYGVSRAISTVAFLVKKLPTAGYKYRAGKRDSSKREARAPEGARPPVEPDDQLTFELC